MRYPARVSSEPKDSAPSPTEVGAHEEIATFDAVAAARELEEAVGPELGSDLGSGARPEASAAVAELEDEIAELGELLRGAEAARAAAEATAVAARADVERAKERIARESKRVLEARSRALLLRFLSVLDDLDRALSAARQRENPEAVLSGVELVRKKFVEMLAAEGVRPMEVMGEAFDPERHDAEASVPVTDASQHGRIVGVIRAGYTMGDAILRPAGVAVGKHG